MVMCNSNSVQHQSGVILLRLRVSLVQLYQDEASPWHCLQSQLPPNLAHPLQDIDNTYLPSSVGESTVGSSMLLAHLQLSWLYWIASGQ